MYNNHIQISLELIKKIQANHLCKLDHKINEVEATYSLQIKELKINKIRISLKIMGVDQANSSSYQNMVQKQVKINLK